jgi:hypothetical protein
MLEHVHSFCTSDQNIDASTSASYVDGDDVYYRFGGSTLASMLKLRYKNIRKCHTERAEIISLEISILQAINTKEKSSMPDYLKYRDNGFMYSPHHNFIPFFKAVDDIVKEVVTIKGFEEHGDQLVKVNNAWLYTNKQLSSR